MLLKILIIQVISLFSLADSTIPNNQHVTRSAGVTIAINATIIQDFEKESGLAVYSRSCGNIEVPEQLKLNAGDTINFSLIGRSCEIDPSTVRLITPDSKNVKTEYGSVYYNFNVPSGFSVLHRTCGALEVPIDVKVRNASRISFKRKDSRECSIDPSTVKVILR